MMEVLTKLQNSHHTIDNVAFNMLSLFELLAVKNSKYKDAWKDFGIGGVMIDNYKKMKRLKNQLWDEEKQQWRISETDMANDIGEEGCIFDTNRDLSGYALLGMGLFKKDEKNLQLAIAGLYRLLSMVKEYKSLVMKTVKQTKSHGVKNATS